MKYLLFILLFLVSCTTATYDTPEVPVVNDTNNSVDKVPNNLLGTYITEDYNDELGIYFTGNFYYQKDYFHNTDYTTWREGRWNYINDTLNLNYKDGGTAFGLVSHDSIRYCEGSINVLFLKASNIQVDVTINPDYTEEYGKEFD